jgi:TM2 domain-containing membrane protein YozV
LQTTLQPPLVRGDTGRAQTRWLVALPSNLVVLGPEGGPGAEPKWVWQSWLPSPRVPVTSADLERWFDGGVDAGRADDGEAFVPSFVCTRNAQASITVVHAPQQLWLLVCSLVLLACGMALFLLARPAANGATSTTTWVGVAVAVLLVLIVVVVVGRFLLPTLVSAVFYGCLPGLVVLVFAFAAHLLMQEHHRRQIVFLPSFTRGRGASSIIRAGGTGSGSRPQPASDPHGEPSTVDILPPVASSLRPLGEVLRTEDKSGSKNR